MYRKFERGKIMVRAESVFVRRCLGFAADEARGLWNSAKLGACGVVVHERLCCVDVPFTCGVSGRIAKEAVLRLRLCCRENLRVVRHCAGVLRLYRRGQLGADGLRAGAFLKLLKKAGLKALGAYALLEKGRVVGVRKSLLDSGGVGVWADFFNVDGI